MGNSLIIADSTNVIVIGIVKDFHYRPLTYEIGPMAFRYSPSQVSIMNIKTLGGSHEELIARLESEWKKFDAGHTLDWKYMDAEIENTYATFKDMLAILSFFSILSISIACLGLLGMVIYSLQSKMAEVAIRKILGASLQSLASYLSRQFLILLLIAVIIFLPIAFFLTEQFLNMFAYKINVGVGMVASVLFIIIALGVLTIGSQVLKVSRVNPIDIIDRE